MRGATSQYGSRMWMAPFLNWRRSSLAAGVALLASAFAAVQVPAGTEVQIRLKSKLSTAASHPKDPVEAIVIAPVILDGNIALPAGATVRGKVVEVAPAADVQHRAV